MSPSSVSNSTTQLVLDTHLTTLPTSELLPLVSVYVSASLMYTGLSWSVTALAPVTGTCSR